MMTVMLKMMLMNLLIYDAHVHDGGGCDDDVLALLE
jgi:hypothetical protein